VSYALFCAADGQLPLFYDVYYYSVKKRTL
jgi:hypothetical protein